MSLPYAVLPATGNSTVDEWIKLALEHHAAGQFPNAERYYRNALRLAPGNGVATHNLAILLAQVGNVNEALLTIERAAIFEPDEPVIHANRALMCLAADRIDEAKTAAEHGMGLLPNAPTNGDLIAQQRYVAVRIALAMIGSALGYPTVSLKAYKDILAVDPKNSMAGVNANFATSLLPMSPAECLPIRKLWADQNRYTAFRPPHENDRDPNRTLRVGYVGGDFKSHSASMMFSHVLLNHDKSKVEPYFYSSLPTSAEADDLTKKYHEAGTWREIVNLPDDQVDAMVRADGIDILVDLAAHTGGGRLGSFVRKPAPIQVTAWGFAHGTGVPEIDVFFADPIVIPEAERKDYTERIFDLPCIVPYRPPTEYGLQATSPAPFWNNEYITFGSFSRFEKLSDECLAMFAEILNKVPNSRLHLKDHAYRRPYAIRRVLDGLPGIDKSRVLFGISTSHPEHMLAYQQVDLCLDTWPHGMGVVTMETLYMGIPLITRYGTQPAGRTAASVLTLMGRENWITQSKEEYVARVVEWANKPGGLAAARKTLRDELLNSPVVKGYREAVEKAYRELWREWCEK